MSIDNPRGAATTSGTTVNKGGALVWGADSILTSTAARYLYPGFEASNAGVVDEYKIRAPRAGIVRNLEVTHNSPSTSSLLVIYTFLRNGASTSLSVTIAGNATTGVDISNEVGVALGDELSIIVTKSSVVSPSVKLVTVTAELV